MIKRTIDISNAPARLRLELGQIVIQREGHPDHHAPAEDIGVLLVDEQRTSYTHAAMVGLMEAGACVILCDRQHLPCGVLLPMAANELLTQRLRTQIAVPLPRKKRLWQQIIRAKLRSQARNVRSLAKDTDAAAAIEALVPSVGSGDPKNCEGQAARIYWEALLGKGFRRQRGGAWPNPILNYGYMVMRAAVARAIAAAGLHPAFGIHHHNRGNAFCLADDLMEPLRALVDAKAWTLLSAWEGGPEPSVTPEAKRIMLGLLAEDVELRGQAGPLMVQLHRVAAGLWNCYSGEQDKLDLPTYNHTESENLGEETADD
jgi:CRISPR-associated protein Cas1